MVVRGGGQGQILESEILLEGIFYQVVRTWGEVILEIWTFSKAKNSILWILNIN